jgi:BirA family transcriptional regulator, biotin operon repressor / biotin---[acetyl-CoA-carboxylase] ligase
LTTFPDGFKRIHLAACASTSDHLKRNLARLEADFPLVVTADVQTAGRGRESRAWASPENLGIYATFGFALPDKRSLPLLSIVSGVAVSGMLAGWTGRTFAMKWPNDVLAGGKKIAGILCETVINAERIICLAGIGINVNQRLEDFPPELRGRAGSLKLLTGREWPVAEGRERLAAGMALWLGKLMTDDRAGIMDRARDLSRSFFGQAISFHHQGQVIRGVFLDIAADGGLLLGLAGGEKKTFYSGELD